VFYLPSHQKNFAIMQAKALPCGLPVAIAEPVNISNQVPPAGVGLVYPEIIASTTDTLRQLLAMAPQERAAMGESAAALFCEGV
jgi:hypothetical protein